MQQTCKSKEIKMAVTRINPHDMFYHEYHGLSDDTKPKDGVPNGSKYTEIDTGVVNYFDADADDWVVPTPADQNDG